jgi:hypothetical protein
MYVVCGVQSNGSRGGTGGGERVEEVKEGITDLLYIADHITSFIILLYCLISYFVLCVALRV